MGMPNRGYGFNILNERAQPVLSLVFERRDDAGQARVEVAKAVAKAVEVTRPALTAAGEPKFRALSAWREGALGAEPLFRRAFAARSLLCAPDRWKERAAGPGPRSA